MVVFINCRFDALGVCQICPSVRAAYASSLPLFTFSFLEAPRHPAAPSATPPVEQKYLPIFFPIAEIPQTALFWRGKIC
jgi:hypothetical protein